MYALSTDVKCPLLQGCRHCIAACSPDACTRAMQHHCSKLSTCNTRIVWTSATTLQSLQGSCTPFCTTAALYLELSTLHVQLHDHLLLALVHTTSCTFTLCVLELSGFLQVGPQAFHLAQLRLLQLQIHLHGTSCQDLLSLPETAAGFGLQHLLHHCSAHS